MEQLLLLLLASVAVLVGSFGPTFPMRTPSQRRSLTFNDHLSVLYSTAAPSTSRLDVNNDLFTAIIIFDVDDQAAQDDLVSKIQDFVALVRNEPGFVSANLHKPTDGTKVANYAQWASKAAFDDFRNNSSLQQSDQAKFLFEYGPPDSRTYEIFAWEDKTAGGNIGTPTIRHGPFVHFAEFDLLNVDLQPRMVELAEEHLGPAMRQDGLLSATFHRSHDGMKVINYGQWENMEAIENLKLQPGFSTETKPYWDEVAANEHHLYEVVSILRNDDA